MIMNQVREKVDQDLKRIGVEIIDVRLKRVDLPAEVSESVYRRMEAERKRIANELRSTGAAEAEDPRRRRPSARGDPGEAYRDAQNVRGQGDARRRPTPRRSTRTPSSTRFTAAWRPTARLSAGATTSCCSRPIPTSCATSGTR